MNLSSFELRSFLKGIGNIFTGLVAIGVGVIVLIGGAPLGMIIIAGVTVAAGTLTLNNGIADTIQSFNDYNYDEVLDEIMTSDILLLDDIGAENNSPWARDEVLGTILQYRMDNDLVTFFTSNFTIDELESVLAETSKDVDVIKARRIVERIKYLTVEEKLISKNNRN